MSKELRWLTKKNRRIYRIEIVQILRNAKI